MIKQSGYRQFLARLPAADAEPLEKARQALQSGDAAFSTTFVTRSGAAYAIEGRRAASGDAVLWLLDASAAGSGPEGAPRSRRSAPDARRHSAAGVAARPRPHPRRLQPSLCERPRHDRRSGCRGRPGIGSRRPPRRMPARRHRRLAPAGRDRRGAMLDGRNNRFRLRSHRSRDRRSGVVAPHQRARRGARDDPRLRRHLRPRQAAQIFQRRVRLDVGHRRRLARRTTFLRGSSGAAAGGPSSPRSRRFPRVQVRAASGCSPR